MQFKKIINQKVGLSEIMLKTRKIVSIRELPTKEIVYDIEVKDAHHYIMKNGVISHNSGGSGAQYAASTIVFLSKAQEKVGTEVTGNVLTCRLVKGRLTKERSIAKVLLDYKTGMSKYYGLLEVAAEAGIAKRVGNKYTFDVTNPEAKMSFEKAIMRNPEEFFTHEVLLKIDEVVKKMYCYGSVEETEEEEEDNYEEANNATE